MNLLPFEYVVQPINNTVQYKVLGLHRGFADSSSLVECGTVSLGEQFLVLRRFVVTSSSGSGCPKYTAVQYNTGVMCCIFTCSYILK